MCRTRELFSPLTIFINLVCGLISPDFFVWASAAALYSAPQWTYNLSFCWFHLVSVVEGLDSLVLEDSGTSFFPELQRQMENRLLADPEMMHRLLGSPFVQSTLSTSSPQLIRKLILSNPQIQQLLQTNPEVEDMLNDKDVITQVGIVDVRAL